MPGVSERIVARRRSDGPREVRLVAERRAARRRDDGRIDAHHHRREALGRLNLRRHVRKLLEEPRRAVRIHPRRDALEKPARAVRVHMHHDAHLQRSAGLHGDGIGIVDPGDLRKRDFADPESYRIGDGVRRRVRHGDRKPHAHLAGAEVFNRQDCAVGDPIVEFGAVDLEDLFRNRVRRERNRPFHVLLDIRVVQFTDCIDARQTAEERLRRQRRIRVKRRTLHRKTERVVRRAAVPYPNRREVLIRAENESIALHADYAWPLCVLRRREGVCLAALHLRLGADSQRKERRRGRLGSGDLVGYARRRAERPLAEIRLGGDGGVRVCGNAHEVHETGLARRRAPCLPRRGGNAEERRRPDIFRVDQVDASAPERCHRRGRGVAGNPHAVGNRLLGDLRSVVRDLARG